MKTENVRTGVATLVPETLPAPVGRNRRKRALRPLTPRQRELLAWAIRNDGYGYTSNKADCRVARNLFVLDLGTYNEQTGEFRINTKGRKAMGERP